MKRKSIIAVLLAAATLALTIAGCGSSAENETKASQKETEVSEAAAGAEAASGTHHWILMVSSNIWNLPLRRTSYV